MRTDVRWVENKSLHPRRVHKVYVWGRCACCGAVQQRLRYILDRRDKRRSEAV